MWVDHVGCWSVVGVGKQIGYELPSLSFITESVSTMGHHGWVGMVGLKFTFVGKGVGVSKIREP